MFPPVLVFGEISAMNGRSVRVKIEDSDLPELSRHYRAELFDYRKFFCDVVDEVDQAEDGDEEGVLRARSKTITYRLKGSVVSAQVMRYKEFAEACFEAQSYFSDLEEKPVIELSTYCSILQELKQKFETQIRLVEEDYELDPVSIL